VRECLDFEGTLHLKTLRILVLLACPPEEQTLQLDREAKVIREAIERSRNRDVIDLKTLTAASPDDLRRAFLSEEYDIVHISGHASWEGPVLDESGVGVQVPLDALAKFVARYKVPAAPTPSSAERGRMAGWRS